MSPSQTAHDHLRRVFAPTQGGVVGLTDKLLEACVGSDVEFRRVGDRCVCRWTVGGETTEAPVPLPPAAFRTVLARVAALCNESSPDAVTPYGGEGLLALRDSPPMVVRVRFVNTPDDQRLEVRRDAERSRRPSPPGVTDAALRAAVAPLADYIAASSDPGGALTRAIELLLADRIGTDPAAAAALETLRHSGPAPEPRANGPADPGAAPDPAA